MRRRVEEQLKAMKDIDIPTPIVTILSRLKSSDLPALEAMADALI